MHFPLLRVPPNRNGASGGRTKKNKGSTRCARVDLVGVEPILSDLRRQLVAVWLVLKFFLAIAPPREHFRAKRRAVWSFAMVDLGGVDKVSERFGQLFFNMGVNGAAGQPIKGRGNHRLSLIHI